MPKVLYNGNELDIPDFLVKGNQSNIEWVPNEIQDAYEQLRRDVAGHDQFELNIQITGHNQTELTVDAVITSLHKLRELINELQTIVDIGYLREGNPEGIRSSLDHPQPPIKDRHTHVGVDLAEDAVNRPSRQGRGFSRVRSAVEGVPNREQGSEPNP